MGPLLAWVWGVVGGFCAAFLMYVAIGGAAALVIAEPYNVDRDCWPHYTLLGIIRTECASPLADAAWHATIEWSRYLVVMPTLALVQLVQVVRTGDTYWLHDALSWGVWGVPILVASAIGFRHLRANAPVLATVLLILLVGQIAVGVAPHATKELVEPMLVLFPALAPRREDRRRDGRFTRSREQKTSREQQSVSSASRAQSLSNGAPHHC